MSRNPYREGTLWCSVWEEGFSAPPENSENPYAEDRVTKDIWRQGRDERLTQMAIKPLDAFIKLLEETKPPSPEPAAPVDQEKTSKKDVVRRVHLPRATHKPDLDAFEKPKRRALSTLDISTPIEIKVASKSYPFSRANFDQLVACLDEISRGFSAEAIKAKRVLTEICSKKNRS